MKPPKLVNIAVMAGLLLMACGVAGGTEADLQAALETQSAQIAQLSTAAAGGQGQNPPPSQTPAVPTPSSGEPVSFQILNDLESPICHLFMWPSGQTGDLGPNRIEYGPLLPGSMVVVTLDPGEYNVYFFDCDGTRDEDLLFQWRSIPIDAGTKVLAAAWMPFSERIVYRLQNYNSVSICQASIRQSGIESPGVPGNRLAENREISPGGVYFFSDQAGLHDFYIADCDGNVLDNVVNILINDENQSFTSPWTGSNGEPVSENAAPTFTASQDTNCRRGPSASGFGISETVFAGQSVPIIGVGQPPAQDWWVVVQDGVECWVWMDTGTASGDTTGVPGVTPPTPPPSPTAGQGQGNDVGEEDLPTCPQQIPIVEVDPSNGAHPTTFTFNISGFEPNRTLGFDIYFLGNDELVYSTELNTNGNGNATLTLNTEATDARGQYRVIVMDILQINNEFCILSADAVFILE
ncbi:MAG: hypothetical protein HYZ26_03665 [Chloroflexi bacterium]|nr:hypothetical protein [Chloroflexota bacterium]